MPLASSLLEKETLSSGITIPCYLVNSLKWSECRNYFYHRLHLISLEFAGTQWRHFPTCLSYRYSKTINGRVTNQVQCKRSVVPLQSHTRICAVNIIVTCEPLQRYLQAAPSLLLWCPKAIYLPRAPRPWLSKKQINTLICILVFYQCSLAGLWAFGFILHQTTQCCPRVRCQMCSIYFYNLIACDGSSQTETSWGARTTLPLLRMHSSAHRSPNRLTTFVTCLEVISEMSWWCCPASGPGMQNYGLNILKDQKGECCSRDARHELGTWGSQELQR